MIITINTLFFLLIAINCCLGIAICCLLLRKKQFLSSKFSFIEAQLLQFNQLFDTQNKRSIEQYQQTTQSFHQFSTDFLQQNYTQQKQLTDLLNQQRTHEQSAFHMLKTELMQALSNQQKQFDQHQLENLKTLNETLQNGLRELRLQLIQILGQNTESIDKRLEKLTHQVDTRLKEISGQVEKRLSEGFEKTTATFTDIIKRLALIDEAQKKITELSSNVVSLQEVLADKRTRGAFGEVQLSALIHNVLPETHWKLQYTLSNGKRADCILMLPEPTGNIIIDAKFPLETYQRLATGNLNEQEKKQVEQQFRIDIKRHIQDISSKYIIANETADGAVMFIPAEAVFAEIHARFPDLVEESHRAKVWMVSPTTLMAILNTARAVLKDAATRKQVHIIQEHLGYLSKDFERFQKRMENLAKHISQANDDVQDVKISADKITGRFSKIERVEVDNALLTLE